MENNKLIFAYGLDNRFLDYFDGKVAESPF